ncbi:hypothetical protein BLNAU_12470 [Blattamonas nauphoetae]|uniref:Uncharacterized protein n=1 Tax=Blattamonas nauphoetae TaxID=2049346 RepID=A0ABQ9XJN0_9EUKA|nr:hypothetical protein BLNAU_12470 [Blattamonas nauphoetae]
MTDLHLSLDLPVSISHCNFAGDKYQLSVPPLSFNDYKGSISILSCSFTTCSTRTASGAMGINSQEDSLVDSCRFEHCKATNRNSNGGALHLGGSYNYDNLRGKLHRVVGCVFADCEAGKHGAATDKSLRAPNSYKPNLEARQIVEREYVLLRQENEFGMSTRMIDSRCGR